MKKGRLTQAFERNHELFYNNISDQQIPVILYVGHCEEDDPLDTWIKEQVSADSLKLYNFCQIICDTATALQTGKV
ncbi:unnamed protein product [Didymodactylos carnosus]|uniref:Uncharacterized protein n=1 Tax=Didymodactylos carnosus TaxID=1234261 RepID=A0A815ABB2_9BILA|nr:unnamed protein product [Didymodactylos carnosus]CAF1253324.1 unnamed protein product [Didymodactylos carnosus]CAF3840637.1 unnamed protein product [Didymodactylos carnosus]CAF4024077.1 unnamed protein product [Didymodactylos carnosus]